MDGVEVDWPFSQWSEMSKDGDLYHTLECRKRLKPDLSEGDHKKDSLLGTVLGQGTDGSCNSGVFNPQMQQQGCD
eukprot:1160744-Pelagomonas_calceolata.AAC.3